MPVAAHKQATRAHLRECECTCMNVCDTTVRVLTSHMHKYIPQCAGALERYSLALIARALLHPIVWVLVLLNATVKALIDRALLHPIGQKACPVVSAMVGPVVSASNKVGEVQRTAVSSEERVSVPNKINRLSAESFDPSLKEIRLVCSLRTS